MITIERPRTLSSLDIATLNALERAATAVATGHCSRRWSFGEGVGRSRQEWAGVLRGGGDGVTPRAVDQVGPPAIGSLLPNVSKEIMAIFPLTRVETR
ncbi:MAG: hypothetical protein OXN93_04325 [bacterium]|nr:hypothetical protein [bacterium]